MEKSAIQQMLEHREEGNDGEKESSPPLSEGEARAFHTWKVIQECLDRLLSDTNYVLERNSITAFKESLLMTRSTLSVESFEDVNMPTWSLDIHQMMSHGINHFFIEEYKKQGLPVETIIIRSGDKVLAQCIIPYYQQ